MGFILQFRSINSQASQSSNSGCEGGLPFLPKLTTVETNALPKWRNHMWLIATRAVSGLSLLAIQLARASRRPLLVRG